MLAIIHQLATVGLLCNQGLHTVHNHERILGYEHK